MRTKNSLIYIPKWIFSEVDAFIPVVLELGKSYQDMVTIDVFWLNERCFNEVKMSSIHRSIFNKYTNEYLLFPNRKKILTVEKILSFLKFLSIVILRKLTRKKIVFVYFSPNHGINSKIQNYVMRVFGEVYRFPGIQAPMNSEYLERVYSDSDEYIKAWRGTRTKPQKLKVDNNEIYFIKDTVDWIHKNYSHTIEHKIIGIPRLYNSWQHYIKNESDRYIEEILIQNKLPKKTKDIILILLTEPNCPWFHDKEDFSQMLKNVLITIRKNFPSNPIFLKTKPRFKNHVNLPIFNDLSLLSFGLSDVYYYWGGASALASRTKVAISINETSTIFEFISTEVPVIEYARYNDDWISFQPKLTVWRGMPGFHIAESLGDLNTLVEDVALGNIKGVPCDEIINFFDAKKDLSVFLH